MPLHVDIRVNDRLINQLHIGRTERLDSSEQTSTYLVVEGIMQPHEVRYDSDGTPFNHRYDEGAEVCVRKALEALEAAR